MHFDIKTSRKGDVTMVSIGGRLILGEASNRLRDLICELAARRQNSILVDLKKVSYIDSGGLGQLVGCYTTVTQRGGELKLTGLSERVADLLELTRLSTVLDIVETDSEGLARLPRFEETHAHLAPCA